MVYWEVEALNDREKIFEFLYEFNPVAAEKTDEIIEAKVENLLAQPAFFKLVVTIDRFTRPVFLPV